MRLIGVAETSVMLQKRGSLQWSFNLEIDLKTGICVPEDSLCQINLLDSAALSELVLFFCFKFIRGQQAGQAWGQSKANALQGKI